MVPTGTFSKTSSPSRPVLFDPSPCRPRCALYSGLNRKCTSVLWRSLDSMRTSPPLPPSPPDGPPRGTNFSRRNARQPLPPSPAFTRILASSMNMRFDLYRQNKSPDPKARLGAASLGFGRRPMRTVESCDVYSQPGTRNYELCSTGSIITNLPIEPRSRNLMRPLILANKVSSLPRPTFRPGFTRVPRCRTMMVPPGTTCPPNALNPRRCALESRPFRELPNPFL